MGEHKSKFRFRLPWLLSSAPASRTAVVTRSPTSVTPTQSPTPAPTETQSSIQPNAKPTTPTQRSPFRPPSVAPAQPSPPQAQTSPRTNSQSTTTKTPTPTTQTTLETQSPAQLTAASSTPTIQPTVENKNPNKTTSNPNPVSSIPAQMPPLRPPRQAAAQNPLPEAQASPKTESQPSSPSLAGFQSQISSQPASPSRTNTQSRATSQPPSPSRALPRSRTASQPQSPSRVSPQSLAASQPSSSARPKPQKSSQTVRQPRLALKPSGQTFSIPSESLIATNVQPTAGTTTQTTSPPKKLNPIESSQPTPSSNNTLSPVSEEQNQVMPPPQSLETQPKTDITNGIISSSSIEATIRPTATAAQPSEQSGPMAAKEKPSPKKKSDNTAVAYEASGSIAHTKEQPSVAFQAEEKQLEKQEIFRKKEVSNEFTSILNGKQTKTMISHPNDKSMVSVSRQKPTTSNGERLSLQKEIRNDISKLVHKMAIANPEQPMEEKPVSVITLIGENRGASMQLGSESAKREGAVHIHRGYKVNPNENAEATSDGEESSKGRSKDANAKDQVTKTHLNNNTQGINNSILFNSSITERNPGVHLTLSRNPTEPIKSNDETESLEARKAKVNITPSQKLTYEPTIRRRCLRGLFMEPSDSDPDNPEKPRRHGCRYSCRDKNKDNGIDVL